MGLFGHFRLSLRNTLGKVLSYISCACVCVSGGVRAGNV